MNYQQGGYLLLSCYFQEENGLTTTRTIKPTKKTSTTTSSASTSAKATEIPVEVKKEKRTFEPEELIPCVSVTPGELFMVGYKSHNLYSWADTDDVIGVEFRDLDYAVKARKPTISEPYIVVDDEGFIQLMNLRAFCHCLHLKWKEQSKPFRNGQ